MYEFFIVFLGIQLIWFYLDYLSYIRIKNTNDQVSGDCQIIIRFFVIKDTYNTLQYIKTNLGL